MIRTGRKKGQTAAALISVLIWAFGTLAGSGWVFCVAGPDHSAFEPVHHSFHQPSQKAGQSEPIFGMNLLQSADSSLDPCVDVPITGLAFSRSSSDLDHAVKLSGLALQTPVHHDLWAWMGNHHTLDPFPLIPSSCNSHLITTVLLI